MIVLPAIDLKDGACVRLKRGDLDAATVYNADPAAQARSFAAGGAQWIHVVDLNGAVAGTPVNRDAVAAILAAVDVPVQLGGGIRDRATVARWLEAGIARVVLGTAAVKDPDFVRAACREFPERVAVGIDARAGKVATDGWLSGTTLDALDLARRFQDAGVAAIVYTDIDRDGVLAGVNVEATARLADVVAIPVIASGGVASLTDLYELKAREGRGIAGVIVGRALYDGRIDLAAALAAAA